MDFSQSRMANGNIPPYRAIMLDTTKKFNVLVATAGAACIGISQKGERRDPSNSDGYAAIAGEPIQYWTEGAKDVPAQLGGSVTTGQRLKATTAGKLIAVAADKDEYVAIANQDGADGDLIAVDVVLGQASQ